MILQGETGLYIIRLYKIRSCGDSEKPMLEIEQKFAGADFVAMEELRPGERQGGEDVEADHYFNAPDREFARTGRTPDAPYRTGTTA